LKLIERRHYFVTTRALVKRGTSEPGS
jgi:hypothetical protein